MNEKRADTTDPKFEYIYIMITRNDILLKLTELKLTLKKDYKTVVFFIRNFKIIG
jgi:hypothetical protein